MDWNPIAKFNTIVDQRAFFNVKVYKATLFSVEANRCVYKIDVSNDSMPDDNLVKVYNSIPELPDLKSRLVLILGDDYFLNDFDIKDKDGKL